MPRGPNPNVEKAFEMYKKGKSLTYIAKKLGIAEGTVRSWKSRYKWEDKCNVAKDEKCNVAKKDKEKTQRCKKKRGAPKGNQNSKGHSEGKGNPNPKPPLKHGGYSQVYWDTLSEEEKELIDTMPKDEETMLIEQIQLFSVRERRIMQAINKYRNNKEPVSILNVYRTEQKRTFDTDEDKRLYEERDRMKILADQKLPGHSYQIQTATENKDNIIARLESELSNVQAKKTRAIEALAKLNLEKEKLSGESSGNQLVDIWVQEVIESRGDMNG